MRPTGQLQVRLLAYLARYDKSTADQASKFIQLSVSTARKHLSILCDIGLAHRTYGPLLARGGRCVYYNLGPGLEAPKVMVDSGAFDTRATVKAWPAMRTVDPWMLPREFFQGAVQCG